MATKEEIKEAVTSPGAETLPPAGFGREEALRMRQDNLDQMIEERANQLALGLIDHKNLKIDPEVARHYADILSVRPANPDRMYCWVETGIRNDYPGHVYAKQAQGWEFVNEQDPECPYVQKTPEGYRRLGTCLLMWVDIERWVELRAQERLQWKKQRGDLNNVNTMYEIAYKYRDYGINVREKLSDFSPEVIAQAERRLMQNRSNLKQQWNRIDAQLREGSAHLNYGNKSHSHI